MNRGPRNHLTVKDAAIRLGHGSKWVLKRIALGEMEGFKHARSDVTVSMESVVAYEDRHRIGRAAAELPAAAPAA